MGVQWKVIKSGAMLERLIGSNEVDGVQYHTIRVETHMAGTVIDGDLNPSFVKRYDDGEEHARSLVERVGDDTPAEAQEPEAPVITDPVQEEPPPPPAAPPADVVPPPPFEQPVPPAPEVATENPEETPSDSSGEGDSSGGSEEEPQSS